MLFVLGNTTLKVPEYVSEKKSCSLSEKIGLAGREWKNVKQNMTSPTK